MQSARRLLVIFKVEIVALSIVDELGGSVSSKMSSCSPLPEKAEWKMPPSARISPSRTAVRLRQL